MSLLINLFLANFFLFLIWITYDLFLSKNRNFQANRFFLLGGSVMAVILPWLPWQLHFNTHAESILGIAFIPVPEVTITPASGAETALAAAPSNPLNWPVIIYLAVVAMLVMISAIQSVKLLIWAKTKPVVKWNNHRIVVISKSWSAFSIFGTIFYPEPFDPESKNTRIILDHESVHIKQLHSIDNLILLIIRILFFYNPAIYLIVRRLRLTHEFIADQAASASDKSEYSHTLISHQLMVPQLILMQSFNNKSFLKRRLIMLSKSKNNRLAGWKYLLVLPLVGGMVLASGWTASAQNQDAGKKTQVKKEVAQKLQEIGFTKTGENSWTKEGITIELSEGQSAKTIEPSGAKTQEAKTPQKTQIKFTPPKISKDQQAKAPQKGQIKFTAPVIVPDTAGHSGKEVKTFSYAVVDVKPEFPGGDEALLKFIRDNTKYPTEAVAKKIEGRVFVGFVISKTGEIEQAKVMRGVEPGLDAEALRVINSMPKWTPGAVAGKPVAVSYQVPMNFTLSKDGTKK